MMPEHPVITHMQRDGYLPSWYYCPDEEPDCYDEDAAYEERRERELFGEN